MKNHSVFLNKIEKERVVLSFRGTVICCCVELAKLSCDWFKMLSLVRDPLVRTNETESFLHIIFEKFKPVIKPRW